LQRWHLCGIRLALLQWPAFANTVDPGAESDTDIDNGGDGTGAISMLCQQAMLRLTLEVDLRLA